ncbi:MAG: phosphatase PAP2 family protein [Microbacteriaceae bacterium]
MNAPEPTVEHQPWILRPAAAVGSLALIAVVVLAVVVRQSPNAQAEVDFDRMLQVPKTSALTATAVNLTLSAQETVGLAALVIGIAILLFRRRRWDATLLLCMAGGSWAFALILKAVVARPRPPVSIWLSQPDPTSGFPSGHTTTALVIVLIVVMVLRGTRWMPAGVVIAAIYAVAVGTSRLYLGNHYPSDVLASALTVCAAASLIWVVLNSDAVRRAAPRVLHATT